MAYINSSVLKDWQDGDVVTALEYKREHNILVVAINDNYAKILDRYTKAEIDALLTAIKGAGYDGTTLLDLQTAINNRYTKAEIDTFNTSFNNRINSNFSDITTLGKKTLNHENRIVLLEQRPTTATAENVSVLDTGNYYLGTNVETILAELGAKVVGAPTKTVISQNRVTISSTSNTASIGLANFDSTKDTLLVFQNSTLLTSNLYTITDSTITLSSGTWNAGTELAFVAFKSVSSEFPVYQGQYIEDGSITNDKLATAIKIGDLSNLTINEKSSVVAALNALIALINGLGSEQEETNAQIATIENEIGDLTQLSTTDKTNLVAAINELFTSSNIIEMIGSLSDLTTTAKNNIVSAINELVTSISINSSKIGNLTLLTTTNNVDLVSAINEIDEKAVTIKSTKESGEFYRADATPDSTTSLKYDGYLTATRIYNAVYNDYAEFFEKENEEEVFKPGDIVKIGENGGYTRTNKAYDPEVVGVVSDEYAFAIGGEEKEKNKIAIGMAGRVHVNLIGPINKGQLITSSNITGVAQKADEYIAGTIIGKALETKKDEKIGKVRMLIMNT